MQPRHRRTPMRRQLVRQSPECRAMIHMPQMRHFMRHHIILHKTRRHDQPPAKHQHPIRRAAPPPAFGVFHRHPPRRHPGHGRLQPHLSRQPPLRLRAQKIMHPPRQKRRIARHMQRAIRQPRPATRPRRMANRHRRPIQHHGRPIRERRRVRQRRQPRRHPVRMRIQQRHTRRPRRAQRQRHDHMTFSGVDSKGDPACAGTPAPEHIGGRAASELQ